MRPTPTSGATDLRGSTAWRRAAVQLTVLVVAGVAAVPATAAHAAVPLPSGKTNFVVAVGGLDAATVNDHDNWVRLGYYTFATDGTVSTNWWLWRERDEPVRVDAGPADCGGDVRRCQIQTVEGFLDDPTGGYRGTYSRGTNGRVSVRWTKQADGTPLDPVRTESWTVTPVNGGKAAKLSSPTFGPKPTVPATGVFSNYGATFGIGYGSTASLSGSSRATMQQLLTDSRYNARTYTGDFVVVANGAVTAQRSGGRWTFRDGVPAAGDPNADNPWRLCASGTCLGWTQRASSCNCGSATSTSKDRSRYLAQVGSGRRNTEWYWCQCLAGAAECYRANNHPRPLLQVVDDNGVFQGWVGVEAFTHVNTRTLQPDGNFTAAYFGVFDMVSGALT